MFVADPGGSIGKIQSWFRSWPKRYGFAVVAVVLAAIVRHGLEVLVGVLPPFVLFFPTVIFVTLLAGFWSGILATLLSTAAVAMFFWAPLNLYGKNRIRDWIGLALFSVIASLFCALTELYRRRERSLDDIRLVVESLEDMIVVVDRNFRYLIANSAFLRYRGMKAEEVIGHRVDEIIDPEVFRTIVKPKIEECFEGKVVRYELQYTYPVLGERTLFISYFPIVGSRGVEGSACVLRDVTDKKRALAALRESEDRYRDLVEHSEDLVCTHDLSGNLLSVNPAASRLLGYEVAELMKIPMRDLIAPEFQAHFDSYLERIKTNGADRGLLCVMTRGGERRIWEYSNTLRTEGVDVPLVRGMAHDVTEEKRAQGALRRREEDYRRFVAQSSEAIFREDLDAPIPIDLPEEELIQRILHDSYMAECNDAMAKMYGNSSAQAFVGKRLTEFLSPDDPRNIELTREYIRSGFRILDRESHETDVHGNPKVFRNSLIGIVEDGKLIRTWGIQRDVTERVKAEEARSKAEEAMRASESHFRILVEQASDGIFIADAQGKYLDANSAGTEMLGYTREEILQKSITDVVSAEEISRIGKELARLQQGGTIRSDWKFQRKDGSSFPGEVSAKRLPDGRLQGIVRDVTERRQAGESLRNAKEFSENLIQTANVMVLGLDTDGNVNLLNAAGEKITGYTFAELNGKAWSMLVPRDRFPHVWEEFDRLIGGTAGDTFENPIVTKTGEERYIAWRNSTVKVNGKIVATISFGNDITERLKAEQELRRNEERFRVALKDSPITVFNQDRELRYTWIYNPHLYLQPEVIGRTDEDLLGAKAAAPMSKLKRRVLESGKVQREEVIVLHDSNHYAFDVTIEPLFGPDRTIVGITGSSVDIAKLRQMADRLQHDKDQLARDKSYLEKEIQSELGFEEIIGHSPVLRDVLSKARVVAATDSTVLLLGETGTGKELVARSVHSLSNRRERNFIKLNCAAVPSGLLESELFGHEKGAFTGAVSQKIGRIELADQGTIFLDEIGELPLELQPKLLRVLQDREFERLGGVRTLHVDVRIIAATNRDLHQDVADKKFREDLFYRLNVFPICSPPLRERRSDIPALVYHFVSRDAAKMGKHIDSVPDETMTILRQWNWPGNVRELENVLERMVILTNGRVLAPPPAELQSVDELMDDLTEMEREHIIHILRETNGVLSGAEGAASRLGMKRTTLQSMLKRLGIAADEYRGRAASFRKPQA